MKRERNKLTAAKVRATKKTGLFSDGFNLYLQVRQFWSVEYVGGDGETHGRSFDNEELALTHQRELGSQGIKAKPKPYVTRSWIFRYWDGKDRKLGLGSAETTSLARARELAQEQRELLRRGVDPIGHVEAKRTERKIAKARAMTFKACADAFIAMNSPGWRNQRHTAQWHSTFNETRQGTRVFPAPTAAINDLPVSAIDTDLVLKVVGPLWTKTPETAARIRGRIEMILDWATASKHRHGDNPARWRGLLDKLLPARSKVAPVAHHPAMAYRDVPAFMTKLRGQEGVTARALELAILTAARAGEVVGSRWKEVDLEQRVWVIAPERMKAKKEHRVALSDRALAILAERPRDGELVFQGARVDRLLDLVRNMGEQRFTVHGFRSSFRDWAAEQTTYPSEMAELALAHRVGNTVENAYRRSDLMERRRRMMQEWAAYCAREPVAEGDNVVDLASARA